MPRPTITAEQRAEMRSHVREALIRIARQRRLAVGDRAGWQNITIRDVIAEAGISIGTFYRYFKDRADLAQTLWVEPVNNFRKVVQADFDSAQSPSAQVRAVLDNYVRFAFENRRLFIAAFLLVRPDDQPQLERIALEKEPFFANLKSALENGQESGDFRAFDPHEMALIFWSAIHGSLALPINFDRFTFEQPQELANAMIANLMDLIAKERDPDTLS